MGTKWLCYCKERNAVFEHNMPKGTNWKDYSPSWSLLPTGKQLSMVCTDDAGHQGPERMIALAQEQFWWPKMVDDCCAMAHVNANNANIFKGALVKAPLCSIWVYSPLELVHVDFTSIETTMELNKPQSVKNVLLLTEHFTRYAMALVTKDQEG